jgi:hypothetical protein
MTGRFSMDLGMNSPQRRNPYLQLNLGMEKTLERISKNSLKKIGFS